MRIVLRPLAEERRRGKNERRRRYGPRRLVVIVCHQASGSESAIGVKISRTPALLTRMSSLPKWDAMLSFTLAIDSVEVTSRLRGRIWGFGLLAEDAAVSS